MADEDLLTCVLQQEMHQQGSKQRGVIVSLRKGKGDIYVPGRYIGRTLLNQNLKLFERILETRVMRIVESTVRENQLGLGVWKR